MKKTIAWNVDTTGDFMYTNGGLYVPKAEDIIPNLNRLTKYFNRRGIQVINTQDWHNEDTEEISNTPDFVNTFPKHGMQNTELAEFIPEVATYLNASLSICEWEKEYSNREILNILLSRNIVIRKDHRNAFKGNINTSRIVSAIHPERIYVYGVATDYCVDEIVMEFTKLRDVDVIVITDAIKEVKSISAIDKWVSHGVKLIKTAGLGVK